MTESAQVTAGVACRASRKIKNSDHGVRNAACEWLRSVSAVAVLTNLGSAIFEESLGATRKTTSEIFHLCQRKSIKSIHGELARKGSEAAFESRDGGRGGPSHVVISASRFAGIFDCESLEKIVRTYWPRQFLIAAGPPIVGVKAVN